MWKKRACENLESKESLSCTTNFVWKSDDTSFYISDNHLAAGWCWMQECNEDEEYNFFHIDAHNDLLTAPSEFIQRVRKQMSLEDYLESRPLGPNRLPYVRWDNFISLIVSKYPQWFNNICFSTQEDIDDYHRSAIRNIPIRPILDIDLACQIETVIQNGSLDNYEEGEFCIMEQREPRKWILSFDLDYFFIKDWQESPQYLTDDFVKEIGHRIQQARERIQVITIAMSPECCKGWDKSFHILEVLATDLPEVGVFLETVAPYRGSQG